jgi:hypothetical protein
MWNRKQKVIQSINVIAEERYLNQKFSLKEDEGQLPEFQVTPEGFGKHKIKYTWKSKGVTIPKDAIWAFNPGEIFQDEKFADIKNALTKIYTNQEEAELAVGDIIRTKSSLFK